MFKGIQFPPAFDFLPQFTCHDIVVEKMSGRPVRFYFRDQHHPSLRGVNLHAAMLRSCHHLLEKLMRSSCMIVSIGKSVSYCSDFVEVDFFNDNIVVDVLDNSYLKVGRCLWSLSVLGGRFGAGGGRLSGSGSVLYKKRSLDRYNSLACVFWGSESRTPFSTQWAIFHSGLFHYRYLTGAAISS